MQLVLGLVVVHVLVIRHVLRNVDAKQAARLVAPAARDVTDRVTAAPEDEHGHVERLDVIEYSGVALDGEVPTADTVAREGVGAAAEDGDGRAEHLEGFGDDWLEDGLVRDVVHSGQEREVDGVILADLTARVV